MASEEFWVNLRTAARVLAPVVSADSPSLDSNSLEQKLRSASHWLPPGWMDDFDPQDFNFLQPADLERLRKNIDIFRQVANKAPEEPQASPQQLHETATDFEEILRLLRPHLFHDFESFKIQYRLEQALRGKLPRWIESFFCETGTDVGGDPAVWVTLHVSKEAVDNELVVTEGLGVRDQVDSIVRRLRTGRWPYIRFLSLDELAAIQKGRRK